MLEETIGGQQFKISRSETVISGDISKTAGMSGQPGDLYIFSAAAASAATGEINGGRMCAAAWCRTGRSTLPQNWQTRGKTFYLAGLTFSQIYLLKTLVVQQL